jgi:succinoglycan biosynthesis protein ExoM
MNSRIAIAICTTGKSDNFYDCLTSVLRQKVIIEKFKFEEVIIVLNSRLNVLNSEIISNLALENSQIRINLIEEYEIGIPYARNKALENAINKRFNYLAFIDDDCTAEEFWLNGMISTITNFGADVSQGSYKFKYSSDYPLWMPKIPDSRFTNGQELPIATTRSVLFCINDFVSGKLNLRFDKDLLHTGGSDTKFFYYMFMKGYKIRASNDSFVIEDMANRQTLKWICFRYMRMGFTSFQLSFRNTDYPNSRLAELALLSRHIKIVMRLLVNFSLTPRWSRKKELLGILLVEFAQLIGLFRGFINWKLKKYY